MSQNTFHISVPCDKDGFITLQCPFCQERFKLTAEEFQREEIIDLFCPYCGLQHEPRQFLNDEVIEQARIVAENYAKSLLNNFLKDLDKSFKGNKCISSNLKKPVKLTPDKILFEKEEQEIVDFSCCEFTIKIKPLEQAIGAYCPCCGTR